MAMWSGIYQARGAMYNFRTDVGARVDALDCMSRISSY